MKVYLASWFETKLARHKERQDLIDAGIECTSRWLDELPYDPKNPRYAETDAEGNSGFQRFLMESANMDLSDVLRSNIVVLFTTDKNETERAHTGGRHFEAGVKFGAAGFCNVITVGPKENVFHFLPMIRNFPTWAEALTYLKLIRDSKEANVLTN